MSNYLPYSEDAEVIPVDEQADVRAIEEAVETLIGRAVAKSGKAQPDVHVKAHGCAKGEFTVSEHLSESLTQGIFRPGAKFPAIVRFSNGAGAEQHDRLPDARGLAIKLFGVEGKKLLEDEADARTQDFVMINHPVFVARDAKDYRRVEKVLVDSHGNAFKTLTGLLMGGSWNPLNWHWNELRTFRALTGHAFVNPAGYTYFSMAPIRYGAYVAKYRVQPARNEDHDMMTKLEDPGLGHDALAKALAKTLNENEVLLDFQVQLQTSRESMPIEDANHEWSEKVSPFETVATLRLFQQNIDTDTRREAMKRLSFTVWHAIESHRPLGGINRLRKSVYRRSSTLRHDAIGASRQEPISLDDIS